MRLIQTLDALGQAGWLIAFWAGIIGLMTVGVAAIIAGGVTWLVESRRSNCFFFALKRWWNHGGYVVMCWSHHTPFPHFVHSFDLETFTEWSPTDPKRRRWLPPLVFAGSEQIWDPPEG